MLNVKKAKEELKRKSYNEIQVDTTWTWASRAVASFENVLTANPEKKVSTFIVGQEYLHEALEHASLVDEDAGELLEEVKLEVMEAIASAVADIDVSLGIDL